jgi:hypothetical protein
MTLNEKWIPSPHYSTGRANYNKAVLHTTEGAQTIESLGSWFQNPSAKCSSHHGADNAKRGVFGAYVYEQNVAWTQGNANGYCVSIELCTPSGAAAGWSRSYWLNNQDTLLRNAADWLAYVCGKYDIPLTVLSSSQAQNASVRGVCQHMNLGTWGSNHNDCGGGFPMDQVIAWAKGQGGGGSQPAPTPEVDSGVAVSVAFDKTGEAWYAAIGQDGKVYHAAPAGGGWRLCDPNQSGAKSGAGIAIADDGRVVVSYTNGSNAACTYTRNPANGSWSWASLGGSVR